MQRSPGRVPRARSPLLVGELVAVRWVRAHQVRVVVDLLESERVAELVRQHVSVVDRSERHVALDLMGHVQRGVVAALDLRPQRVAGVFERLRRERDVAGLLNDDGVLDSLCGLVARPAVARSGLPRLRSFRRAFRPVLEHWSHPRCASPEVRIPPTPASRVSTRARVHSPPRSRVLLGVRLPLEHPILSPRSVCGRVRAPFSARERVRVPLDPRTTRACEGSCTHRRRRSSSRLYAYPHQPPDRCDGITPADAMSQKVCSFVLRVGSSPRSAWSGCSSSRC